MWRDHNFLLARGPRVAELRESGIDRFSDVYIEERKGERGIVWFDSRATLIAYKAAMRLDDNWQVTVADPFRVTMASADWWQCVVAFRIRMTDARTFVRDVTVLTDI
jgi:hypothetical protein